MYGDNNNGFKPFPSTGTMSFVLNGLRYNCINDNAKIRKQQITVVSSFCLSLFELNFLSNSIKRVALQVQINKVPSRPAQSPDNL